jgi:hypothetical protein
MKPPTTNACGRRIVAGRPAILVLAFVACSFAQFASPGAALSAAGGTFQTSANPGGGTILTGTVGPVSSSEGAANLLRRVHAELGLRPTVVQAVRNDRDGSLALLFTAGGGGRAYTGIGLVRANSGAQTAVVALYDTSARFHTTAGPMMRRLGSMTVPMTSHDAVDAAALAPAQPLVAHPFADGTGSIGIPAGWTLNVGGGGSAMANAPSNVAQVSYNMHFTGIDLSNARAAMYWRTASPLAKQNLHGALLPYESDPMKAWVAMYETIGRQNGLNPQIRIIRSTSSGSSTDFTGTLGSGPKTIHFIVHAFVLPPNPNGLWSLSDSHVFVRESDVARQAATASAVLSSVRINFGAVAAQQDAIRQSFQRMFDADIANDRAQYAARQQRTDEALASDRAAQEGMHKDAVAMENYSLDRAVVVNTTTGVHSTVDSDFADVLVQGNSNYQKVPAADLLRGIDY